MFSRSALRSVFSLRWTAPNQIPSFTSKLPQRACLHQTATAASQGQLQSNAPGASSTSASLLKRYPRGQAEPIQQPRFDIPVSSSSSDSSSSSEQQTFVPQTRNHIPPSKLPIPPTFSSPLKITKSLARMLPYLTTQPPWYISAHLHARPYLLTEGDHLRLPFLMPKVKPGDILRFNRATVIGSRDFTLKGTPYIDERMFECRVRVLGVDAEPMRIKEKTKRRQRHVRHIKSKHRYTLMRVMELRVKSLEELLEEGAEIIEDGAEGANERVEKKS
ncbi:putative aconitate hydratase [Thermoascus aurantiacus ATCC 26904]